MPPRGDLIGVGNGRHDPDQVCVDQHLGVDAARTGVVATADPDPGQPVLCSLGDREFRGKRHDHGTKTIVAVDQRTHRGFRHEVGNCPWVETPLLYPPNVRRQPRKAVGAVPSSIALGQASGTRACVLVRDSGRVEELRREPNEPFERKRAGHWSSFNEVRFSGRMPSVTDLSEVVWRGAVAGGYDATDLAGRLTVRDAERVQLAVLDRHRATGDTLAGWKIAATSGRGRNAFGPGVRPFGFVLGSRVFSSGSTVELRRINRPGLETELCFRVGARLAGDVTAKDVRNALAAVAPAFEINEDRVVTPERDLGVIVADNLKQWGIVVGPEVKPLPQTLEWETLVSTIHHDGDMLERVVARDHIDDHFASIAALARELSVFDLALDPGALVITGSFTRQDVSGPGQFRGTFEGLGDVEVALV